MANYFLFGSIPAAFAYNQKNSIYCEKKQNENITYIIYIFVIKLLEKKGPI